MDGVNPAYGTGSCMCGRRSPKEGGRCSACDKEFQRYGNLRVDRGCPRSERNPRGSLYVARLVREIDAREKGAPDRLRGRLGSNMRPGPRAAMQRNNAAKLAKNGGKLY